MYYVLLQDRWKTPCTVAAVVVVAKKAHSSILYISGHCDVVSTGVTEMRSGNKPRYDFDDTRKNFSLKIGYGRTSTMQ